MKHLHHLVENSLEAPALAWNILAYYWGMSAFGLGPAYKDYMQSDAASLDAAWNDESNEDLNRIAGLSRRLTIKERFDRAVNFYAYCYEQGRINAINPPFDSPPTVDDLMQSRLHSDSKTPPPDKFIQTSSDFLLSDRPELQKLWALGEKEQREQRAQAYNARVLETLRYVASEMKSSCSLLSEQLSEQGFLLEGIRGDFNVTTDMMDEAMPEEVQDRKFGECYIEPSSTESPKMVLSGIFGAYYTMGHNIELAMYDEESKRRLASTHTAILGTWRQLYDISKEEKL